jgi:hypothetical protein
MFHLIAAVACVAAGTLFVTVFGITGITAERDYVSSHRGAGCVKSASWKLTEGSAAQFPGGSAAEKTPSQASIRRGQ